jgi:MYXO-CTERM domain-containing protein
MRKRNLVVAGLSCAIAASAHAGAFTNPTPTVRYAGGQTILRMELGGNPNYGVLDSRADVAYTGESNTWTFTLPTSIPPSALQGASFRASMIADDHYDLALSLYRFEIRTNGGLVHSGLADLPHGEPFGTIFENWEERDFAVAGPASHTMTFSLRNTSGVGEFDWFAVDSLELRLPGTLSVPEPASWGVAALGAAGLGLARRRQARSSRT